MPGRECTGDSGRRWGQRGSHHEGSGPYPERQGIFREYSDLSSTLAAVWGWEAGQKLGGLCKNAPNHTLEKIIHSKKGPRATLTSPQSLGRV